MHRWHGYCRNRLQFSIWKCQVHYQSAMINDNTCLASPLLLPMSTNIPIVTIPGLFACISPTLITMEATSPMEPFEQ